MKLSVLPGIHDFIISRNTADSVFQMIQSIAPERQSRYNENQGSSLVWSKRILYNKKDIIFSP
ncbi:MAG: hypothetical protein LBJ67_12155 [Planctomycetaceae bacterium]|nr:hypothetical protein [Planctomycetaceae bacterium]